MKQQALLAQIEDLIRSAPSEDALVSGADEAMAWTARATVIIGRWNNSYQHKADYHAGDVHYRHNVSIARATLLRLLHQARADLRFDMGQQDVIVSKGYVFDYFDELRKAIETARLDLLFVDPYLDAEFVARYLPYVAEGVAVRLLGSPKKMATLLPAIDSFTAQAKAKIQVRASSDLHDRCLFVDERTCFLSGASFKDGAKNAPTMLNQVRDGFAPMWATYQAAWDAAALQR